MSNEVFHTRSKLLASLRLQQQAAFGSPLLHKCTAKDTRSHIPLSSVHKLGDDSHFTWDGLSLTFQGLALTHQSQSDAVSSFTTWQRAIYSYDRLESLHKSRKRLQ